MYLCSNTGAHPFIGACIRKRIYTSGFAQLTCLTGDSHHRERELDIYTFKP